MNGDQIFNVSIDAAVVRPESGDTVVITLDDATWAEYYRTEMVQRRIVEVLRRAFPDEAVRLLIVGGGTKVQLMRPDKP